MSNIKTKEQLQYQGKQSYINSDTGEVIDLTVMSKKVDTDFNFHKIWLKDLIKVLEALGSPKVKVFIYILETMNSENIAIGTIRAIAEKLKISNDTVRVTIKILKDLDYLRMKQNGVYQLSPNLLVKGKSNRRQTLLMAYNNINVSTSDKTS